MKLSPDISPSYSIATFLLESFECHMDLYNFTRHKWQYMNKSLAMGGGDHPKLIIDPFLLKPEASPNKGYLT